MSHEALRWMVVCCLGFFKGSSSVAVLRSFTHGSERKNTRYKAGEKEESGTSLQTSSQNYA